MLRGSCVSAQRTSAYYSSSSRHGDEHRRAPGWRVADGIAPERENVDDAARSGSELHDLGGVAIVVSPENAPCALTSERATTQPLERPPLWPVLSCRRLAGFEVSTEARGLLRKSR